jgi:hypothetical protein
VALYAHATTDLATAEDLRTDADGLAGEVAALPSSTAALLTFAPLRADVNAVQELAVAAERLNQLPGGNATGVDRQRQDPLQDRRHLIDCICRLRRGVRVIAIIDHVRPQLSDTRTS